MSLLDAALAYAARGWPVFPLRPKDKVPLSGSHAFKEATTDPNLIERWWGDRWPEANLGLATGSAAKLWVLDVDGEDGARSRTQLESELGPLPDTLSVETGGGGRHYYFAWPEEREVRNRANVRPGIDVRGEGGYVVLPPSIHPSGRAYAWKVDDKQPIAPAPQAWLGFFYPPKVPPVAPWERVDPRTPPPPTAGALLQDGRMPVVERARAYLNKVAPAVQSQGGHNALLWAARCLVVGFELPEEQAIELLWSDYNPRCVPPWNRESEVDRKDFERKVRQAKELPFDKPRGWLLDGLGHGIADEAARSLGETSAAALLATAETRSEIAAEDTRSGTVDKAGVAGGNAPAPLATIETTAGSGQREAEALITPATTRAGRRASFVRVSDVERQEVSWLWKPFLPRAKFCLLEGDPGAGKTFLACVMSAIVSRGWPFPGTEGARPLASVVYASAEDGIGDTLRPRLEAAGADLDRVHVLTGWRETLPDGKTREGAVTLADVDVLDDVLGQVRPELVVIDPIVGFIGSDVDTSKANEVRSRLVGLVKLAEKYGCTILAVRHLSKGAASRALYRGQGSIDFAACARSVLMAGEDPQSKRRAIVHLKSSLAPAGQSIGYALGPEGFAWTGTSELTAADLNAPDEIRRAPSGRESVAVDFLRDFLADGPRLQKDVEAAAERVGISGATLTRAKKSAGVVARRESKPGARRGEGWWKWRLPDQPGDQGDVIPRGSSLDRLETLNGQGDQDSQQTFLNKTYGERELGQGIKASVPLGEDDAHLDH